MINVLWVDDDIFDVHGNYNQKSLAVMDLAADEGIEIKPYQNYSDALDDLCSNPQKWNAIILDICNDRVARGNSVDGYTDALNKIKDFQKTNNQKEPYIFTFSGSDMFATEEQQAAIEKRDYAKRVYAKPDECALMFKDIKKIVSVSPLYKLCQQYKDIMSAIEESLEWSSENKNRLWKIIVDIETGHTNAYLLNEMRKLLESEIMQMFHLIGIQEFPEESLNQQSNFIGSRKNIPVYIQRSFHSLSQITNNGSHNLPNSKISSDVQTGKAPYLLKSCMYELFNIIIWQSELLQAHSDDEIRKFLSEAK